RYTEWCYIYVFSSFFSCLLQTCLSSRYGFHPDLHSFPTRRSSDLQLIRSYSSIFHWRSGRCTKRCSMGNWTTSIFRKPLQKRSRSEEHTSELQSRENLVCRLLLEKKNKTDIYFL